jgi:hypothetical protein
MELTCAPAIARTFAHRRHVRRLVGHRHPVGRHAKDVGALESSQAEDLREPDVVADRGGQTSEPGLENGDPVVPALAEAVLGIPEVKLPVNSEEPFRRDDGGRVVEPIAVALAKSGDEVDPMDRRGFCPSRERAWRGFGRLECFLARLEDVARGAKLRQHNELCPGTRRFADELEAAADVVRCLADPRFHLRAGDPNACRTVRHRRALLYVTLRSPEASDASRGRARRRGRRG